MECPVCGRVFPTISINNHVNTCLNTKECEEGELNCNIPITNVAQKRKSGDWSFLQAVHKDKDGPQNIKKPKTIFSSKTKLGEDKVARLVGIKESNETCTETLATSNVSGKTITSETSTSTISENNLKNEAKVQSKKIAFAPLAEQMRPQTLEDYVGQEKAMGKESMLYSLLTSDFIPSLILWGPPGCGKTSLARVIANNCRTYGSSKFVHLSAAACGVNEVKETIKIAHTDQKMFHKKTILFLDEIHRFNKSQQDILLPHVENGTITLIGATTENPSFQVNSALLSRCRVVVLEKLSTDDILIILQRALRHVNTVSVKSEKEILQTEVNIDRPTVYIHDRALEVLASLVDGDARAALNGLQMAVEAKNGNFIQTGSTRQQSVSSLTQDTGLKSKSKGTQMITINDIKEGLQRSHVLYDKTGDEHYNIISALHKSMRGSDASAALYWLARMLEGGENPLYIARRLIRFASEDIGLADPSALTQAVAAYQGSHLIGMPECEVLLAQCVVYLSRAPKSVEIYKAFGHAKACVKDHKGPLPSVPLHLRNAPTRLMKSLGYGKEYKYNPDYDEPVDQAYFPSDLVGTDFFS